jgi:hypothetical protein
MMAISIIFSLRPNIANWLCPGWGTLGCTEIQAQVKVQETEGFGNTSVGTDRAVSLNCVSRHVRSVHDHDCDASTGLLLSL